VLRPAIFLDIDGVLNSVRTAVAFRSYQKFDGVGVALIDRICQISNAVIVVSSTWRLGVTLKQLLLDISEAGGSALVDHIVGVTPRLTSGIRGAEIHHWLAHEGAKHLTSVADEADVVLADRFNYVIIDDDSDFFENQKPRFVQTDNRHGFGLAEFVKALDLLKPDNTETADLKRALAFPLINKETTLHRRMASAAG
jgi:hypothetical protein